MPYPASYSPGTVSDQEPVGAASRAAIGGIVTQVGRWTVHTFLSSGTLTVRRKVEVEYLGVAGGGSGGGGGSSSNSAGGGGAGGVLTNVGGTKLALAAGSYVIVIGAGGPSVPVITAGVKGSNSTGLGLSAVGGGFGGRGGGSPDGGEGGSGGGAGKSSASYVGGSGTAGQGFKGGDTSGNLHPGAGGGGAGGAGGDDTAGGTAGAGIVSTISGITVNYASGGLGGKQPGTGAGEPGPANTGNGGGGGQGGTGGGDPASGAGGSGIFVVRYLR